MWWHFTVVSVIATSTANTTGAPAQLTKTTTRQDTHKDTEAGWGCGQCGRQLHCYDADKEITYLCLFPLYVCRSFMYRMNWQNKNICAGKIFGVRTRMHTLSQCPQPLVTSADWYSFNMCDAAEWAYENPYCLAIYDF